MFFFRLFEASDLAYSPATSARLCYSSPQKKLMKTKRIIQSVAKKRLEIVYFDMQYLFILDSHCIND